MSDVIVSPQGHRLRKIAKRTTTPASDTSVKAIYADTPRVCYNMPNEEFFALMLSLREKTLVLVADRLGELERWSRSDRDKVKLWFGNDSESTRNALQYGLARLRQVTGTLKEHNFVKFTPEGVQGVGCFPRSSSQAELPAAASVCKTDGTYTIFIGSIFCDAATERNQIGTGIPVDVETKLTMFIHEVSHFKSAMGSQDLFYSLRGALSAARRQDAGTLSNADNVAYYVANIPNWRTYSPPEWRP